MSTTRFPTPGETVRFNDGDRLLNGVCNGNPVAAAPDGPVYVPVYVREGDRCLMVAADNIIHPADA